MLRQGMDGWMRWTTCVARSCCWLLLHDVKQYAIWSTVYESMKYLNEICSEISTSEIKDHKLKETPLMNFKINAPNQLTNWCMKCLSYIFSRAFSRILTRTRNTFFLKSKTLDSGPTAHIFESTLEYSTFYVPVASFHELDEAHR